MSPYLIILGVVGLILYLRVRDNHAIEEEDDDFN